MNHVSTYHARPSLTSVIGRELVHSRRYESYRMTLTERECLKRCIWIITYGYGQIGINNAPPRPYLTCEKR